MLMINVLSLSLQNIIHQLSKPIIDGMFLYEMASTGPPARSTPQISTRFWQRKAPTGSSFCESVAAKRHPWAAFWRERHSVPKKNFSQTRWFGPIFSGRHCVPAPGRLAELGRRPPPLGRAIRERHFGRKRKKRRSASVRAHVSRTALRKQ